MDLIALLQHIAVPRPNLELTVRMLEKFITSF